MTVLLPDALFLDDRVMARAAWRFADAFPAAWAIVPADAQAAIRDYLNRCPGIVHLCYRMDDGSHPREPWGRCCWYSDRTVLTFLAPFVERVDPIDGLVSVIGHELAHCFRRGSGACVAHEAEEEAATRAVTAVWGLEDPAPSDGSGWSSAIEEWRRQRAVEFGHYTERKLLEGL